MLAWPAKDPLKYTVVETDFSLIQVKVQIQLNIVYHNRKLLWESYLARELMSKVIQWRQRIGERGCYIYIQIIMFFGLEIF